MGHIDSGKTTLLDKIKGTSIVKQEAGRITQHIGATEITIEIIKGMCGKIAEKYKFDIQIPGLLFIDTPGHNAFDNLRERGGSLADLVVLVVDVNKGMQAQDIETLEILKMYKTPFIVAANKIDLLNGWHQESENVSDALNSQSKTTDELLDKQCYKIVGQLYEHGFQAERFDRINDFTKQIVIVPISAEKGYGIQEIVLFLAALSQKFLGKRLAIDDNQLVQGAVLEVGEIKGVGPTADVIVYQGILRVRDKIMFQSRSGIVETKIKALLKLNVMSAVNKKRDYQNVDFVSAACGVKIVAPDLEQCVPGGVIVSAEDKEAVERLKEKPLSCITKCKDDGAYVKADTLGSLEALIKLMEKNCICIAKTDIGEVTSKDILELKVIHEKDRLKGVLFLFNVNISKEFEVEAEKDKIPIFKNNIIYKLIEDYLDWLDKEKRKDNELLLKGIIYPCKIKVLPNHVFRTCKPAVVGIRVLTGKLVPGAKLLNNEVYIGAVESIQADGKGLAEADEGKEVAIAIKDATYLKDFKEESVLEVDVPLSAVEKLEQTGYEFSLEEQKLIIKAKERLYKTKE